MIYSIGSTLLIIRINKDVNKKCQVKQRIQSRKKINGNKASSVTSTLIFPLKMKLEVKHNNWERLYREVGVK